MAKPKYRRVIVKLSGEAATTRPEIDSAHREIVEACKARDPQRAADAMRRHLVESLDVAVRELAGR